MIVLVGFMGAGKSTIGRLLADRLGLSFTDTDPVIEQRAGRPISQIFAADGEPAFRALEHEVIAGLLDGPDAVLALGGGAPEHPGTRALLKTVDVIYLEVSYSDAMARIGGDTTRPLLAQAGLRDRYEHRLPIYSAMATLTIPTTARDPGTIAEEILAKLAGSPLLTGGSSVLGMPEIHAARRERALEKIAEVGADAALVTSGPNVYYLTGLSSSNAALLLAVGGDAVLATDSRYAPAAERDCPDVELIVERFVETRLVGDAKERGMWTVAFEAHEMTVERHADLAARAEGVTLVPFGRRIEELREIKEPSELELLATACRISSQALADVFPVIRPGLTERSLAAAIDRRMVELGADRPAFSTIVASGPNGATPHHSPTERPLRRGDLITMDFGAVYHGYHADMTRTVALGDPAGWQREIYELVAAAQRSGIEAARPGADVGDVDAAARDLIRDAGHGDHFQHGLGHGVGLQPHEAPMMGYGRTGKLTTRVAVTVEPGVYLPGKGGVRIEDVLAVGAGAAGGAAFLTTTTRDLLVL